MIVLFKILLVVEILCILFVVYALVMILWHTYKIHQCQKIIKACDKHNENLT